jgi:hypothetical protein
MRLAALSIASTILALAGCQAGPDVAAIPHAALAGTHVEVDGDRLDVFRTLRVDGRVVLPATDEPAKVIAVDATQLLPAGRSAHVEVEGLAFYRNTLRRLFFDPMHVQGTVDFVPVAGARYALHGSITPELSSVWIEDEATHAVVGTKVSAVGRGTPASAPASDDGKPVSPTLRSGGA